MNEPKRLVVVTLLVGLCVVAGCGCPAASNSERYSWRQTDSSLALVSDGNIVWQLNYDRKEDKPYFHPVALADGTVLTELRPTDHPWHRGLWWSWKFINRLNYWEDDAKTFLAPGRNEITAVEVKPHKDGGAEAQVTIEYHPPGRPAVVTESRMLKMSPPDEKGAYRIDWTSEFTAGERDVLFDRTPILGEPCGVVWGGYAGLSVRLARGARKWQATDSEGHTFDKEFNNAKARWLDYTIEAAPAGKEAGIAILDHPSNPRHPTPWYVILGDPMRYYSPAFIFYEPYTLGAGKTLALRYRIVVHPGRTDKERLEKEWEDFSKTRR